MDDDSDVMLSTVDNPWSPFDSYDEWYAFDSANGYDTLNLLARIANVSLDLTDDDLDYAIRIAMSEIVNLNVSGKHVLVSRPAASV
jgi:hypothetical protein